MNIELDGGGVEIKGGKVFRNSILVGAVWEFGGDWYCRIFAGQARGSKRFHMESNAMSDALVRARSVSDAEANALVGSVIQKIERPTVYSD